MAQTLHHSKYLIKGDSMNEKIKVDSITVNRCRKAAGTIAGGISDHIEANTTTSVERSVLRLLGIDGVAPGNIPLPNIVEEYLGTHGLLEEGGFYWIANAVAETGRSPQEIASGIASEELPVTTFPRRSWSELSKIKDELTAAGLGKLRRSRGDREHLQEKYPRGPKPWLYVIVATGNIYEDVTQAKAAALQGADIIAVIRTTAQSLLDYVPYGPTTEGFGGTYATQENFRIMRQALDEAGEQAGRYIQLVNYCSGLCMPEIAVTGGMERLDMMLNDSMYGILFRDINMKRTFIDQDFSRTINAFTGIIINTGEDNYLTTSDAVEEAHTVLSSQFINHELAQRSGMSEDLMGLGHAFEINPDLEDGLLFEIAGAQLVRQLFPDSPVKYMPPTKYKTGDIFRSNLQDGLFNLTGILTGQSIQLLGMLTEAIHTPFLQDRALSIDNAKYVFNTARHLGDEIVFSPDGIIQRRSEEILMQAANQLEDIAEEGLMNALSKGAFASISRPVDGGKGATGVIRKGKNYRNPFMEKMREELI